MPRRSSQPSTLSFNLQFRTVWTRVQTTPTDSPHACWTPKREWASWLSRSSSRTFSLPTSSKTVWATIPIRTSAWMRERKWLTTSSPISSSKWRKSDCLNSFKSINHFLLFIYRSTFFPFPLGFVELCLFEKTQNAFNLGSTAKMVKMQ